MPIPSAYRKDISRTIRGNLKRFISIAVICALGVAMFCGLRASCNDLRNAGDAFFDAQGLFDVQILSTLGIDDNDLAALEDVDGVERAEGGWTESTYTAVDDARASVEVKALSESGLNEPFVVEGALPQSADEVAVTQKFVDASGLSVGDTVEIDEAENEDEAVFARHPYTICGIVVDAADVNNPELSFRSSSTSDYTFIVSADAVENDDTYTVAYLTITGAKDLACFSDEYVDAVHAVTDYIDDEIRDDREAARTATVKGDAQEELDEARAEYEEERADAEAELADGKAELDDGKAELDDAAAQLEDAAAEIADGQAQIDDGWAEIADGQRELANGWAEYDRGAADGRAQVEQTLADAMRQGQAQIDEQIEAGRAQGLVELNKQFDIARTEAQAELEAGIAAGYEQGLAQIDEQFAAAREEAQAELDAQIEAGYQQALDQLNAQFDAAREEAQAELDAQIEAAREQAYTQVEQKLEEEGALAGRDQLTQALAQLQSGMEQIEAAISSYNEAVSAIEAIDAQLAELDPEDPENAALIEELTAKKTELQQIVAAIDEQQGGVEGLNAQLAALQEQAAPLQEQLDQVNAAIDAAYAAADEQIEAGRAQGQQELDERLAAEYEAALKTVDEEIAVQREQAQQQLEATLGEEYAAALDTLEAEIEQQRAAAQAELDARLDQEYDAALDTLNQTISEQRAAAQATLEAQMASGRETAYAQLSAQLASARTELDAAEQQLADARAQLIDAQAELDEGRAEYADGLAEYQDGLAEWQDGMAEWEEGRAEADEQFAEAEAELADAQAEIDDIDTATWYVQPRSSLSSYSSISSDADSIEAIGTLFPIVFLVVAVLVALTTITRLVEEERGLIGTYKALGYRNSEIFAKYLIYALSASLGGSLVGLFLGFIALPAFIFTIFGIMYLLPSYWFSFEPLYGFGGMAIFVVAIGGTAYLACRSEVRRTPAALMRPKAPKSGSRIFLERIPFVWSRLSFLNKVTARNIFRYKRRFFMTVAGILGCTALIVCGFAIKDSVAELVPEQYERIAHYDIMAVTETGEHDAATDSLEHDGRVDQLAHIYLDSTTLKRGEDEETVQLLVIPEDCDLSDYIHVTDRDTGTALELPENGAIVTLNASEVLGFSAGDTLELQDTQLNQAYIEVVAVAANYLGNYVYMSEDAYRAAFGEDAPALDEETGEFAPNGVLIRCPNAEDAASLTDELGDDERFLSVTSTDELADDFSQSFMLINAVVAIVLGMAAALAFAVLFTLSTTNISERERELATIKVLGFRPREVHHYVNKETIILTMIGIVCGLPFGYVLGDVLLHALKMPSISFLTTVTPLSYVLAAILPLVFALVVNLITNRTLNRINMIEALKSVE